MKRYVPWKCNNRSLYINKSHNKVELNWLNKDVVLDAATGYWIYNSSSILFFKPGPVHVHLLSGCLSCLHCVWGFVCLSLLSLSSCVAFPPQKLQEQDERAEQVKGRLRWEQRELRVRLEQLQRASERMRNDSLGSTMSCERSDSDRGKSLTPLVSSN